VFGTVHGLVGGEVAQVRTTLHSVLLTATVTVSDIDHDNLYFLRQHLILG
jgi:hypothetical protein